MGKHSFREFVGRKIHNVLDQRKVRDLQIDDFISSEETWSREVNVKRTKASSRIFGNPRIVYYNFRAWGLITTPTFLLFQSPFRDWYFKNLLWSGCDAQMAAYVYSLLFFLLSVLHVPVICGIPGSWAESMQSRAVVWGSFRSLDGDGIEKQVVLMISKAANRDQSPGWVTVNSHWILAYFFLSRAFKSFSKLIINCIKRTCIKQSPPK